MTPVAVSPALAGWTIVSLRPRSQQAAVRAAVQARGAQLLALPALRLEALPVEPAALDAAYAGAATIFTSPAAVDFAHAARALPATLRAIAVGSGTARELSSRGIHAVQPPPHAMHSEGVLALPQLQAATPGIAPTIQPRAVPSVVAPDADARRVSQVAQRNHVHRAPSAADACPTPGGPRRAACIGLVTAPGGRDVIAPTLRARGFELCVVHVYRRLAAAFTPSESDALQSVASPRAVLLTSAEALGNALAALPAAARSVLLDSTAVASSERLLQRAREAGFAATLAAASPRTESLLEALAAHAKGAAIR